MATIENGYLGGFAGTLGPAIGYFSRGRWCVRSKPSQVRNPRTKAQTEHRTLFKEMVCFASTMREVITVGMRHEASLRHLSIYNLFVYNNKRAFSMGSEAVQIDCSQLSFSCGTVAPVGFGVPQCDRFLNVTVPFEKNPLHLRASASDTVYLVAYNPQRQKAFLSDPAARRSTQVTITLPGDWQEEEVHLYGFSHDAEGRSSECSYLGTLPAATLEPEAVEPEPLLTEVDPEAEPKPVRETKQKIENQYTLSFFDNDDSAPADTPG